MNRQTRDRQVVSSLHDIKISFFFTGPFEGLLRALFFTPFFQMPVTSFLCGLCKHIRILLSSSLQNCCVFINIFSFLWIRLRSSVLCLQIILALRQFKVQKRRGSSIESLAFYGNRTGDCEQFLSYMPLLIIYIYIHVYKMISFTVPKVDVNQIHFWLRLAPNFF